MVVALDKYHRPMGFVTERRARKLLDAKRAYLRPPLTDSLTPSSGGTRPNKINYD